jgi:hypothetical protein
MYLIFKRGPRVANLIGSPELHVECDIGVLEFYDQLTS